jgi:sterol desaturase/sphingolipid hydroxylase (fatty acid hydroxylase superfamily)
MPLIASQLFDALAAALRLVFGQVAALLLSPGSSFSLLSLLVAFMVALSFLAVQRRRKGRAVRLKVLLRALLPRRMLAGPSTRADLGMAAFNVLIFGVFFNWAIVSYRWISAVTHHGLTDLFGSVPAAGLPAWAASAILTLALFLAYELGFWVDHILSHRVPVLWAFHKTHHTAEVLTPLTNFRVHPVDGIKFANILAVFVGATDGLVNYLIGRPVSVFAVADRNIILLLFVLFIIHLQHSHIWIAATGRWGKIFLSPAHHQIHHSADPAHFDRNFGSYLSVWDWLFGTLHVPARMRERLTFGVTPIAAAQHGAAGLMIAPLGEALAALRPGQAEPVGAEGVAG